MREVDERWHKALVFFADNNRAKAMDIKENDNSYYRGIVPQEVENTLIEMGHIDFESDTRYIITQSGLQQLRGLDKISHRDWTRIIAIIALIVSILSLGVTQGWWLK
ncbi:MAG: hypothetical protein ABIB47_01270 [Candidatus Woesearchaeota archaeon]